MPGCTPACSKKGTHKHKSSKVLVGWGSTAPPQYLCDTGKQEYLITGKKNQLSQWPGQGRVSEAALVSPPSAQSPAESSFLGKTNKKESLTHGHHWVLLLSDRRRERGNATTMNFYVLMEMRRSVCGSQGLRHYIPAPPTLQQNWVRKDSGNSVNELVSLIWLETSFPLI